MNKEIKWKDVPLTDDEKEDAALKKAQLESKIETLNMNLKHLAIDKENKYSERMSVLNARRSIEDMEKKIKQEIETSESNLKIYSKQLKTGMKKEMIDEPEETKDKE